MTHVGIRLASGAAMTTAVLLDVDGTLIDSNLLHVLAWSRAFRRMGREIDAGTVLHAIGMGGDRLAPAILGEGGALAEEARQLHAEAYLGEGLIRQAMVLPGAAQLLGALHRRGVPSALASSARGEELDHYVALLGGPGAVTAVVTGDDVPSSKPAPHIFAVALAKLGRPERALVVGDTVYDVAAARELGIPCLCVLTGGIPRRTLEEASPAAIYDGAAAILRDLDRALSFNAAVARS
jgi:HAD superfamily hydrolase (TIGR01509 family)